MPVDEAFGVRLDQGAASVVISGDTRWSDNLIAHSKDASLLVHEVYLAGAMQEMRAGATEPQEQERFRLVGYYHTPSNEVGKIAAQANASHLILSHIIRSRGNPQEFENDITPDYGGKLTVGEDLMTFEVRGNSTCPRQTGNDSVLALEPRTAVTASAGVEWHAA